MQVDECYQLGYILKPHGLQGELDVFLDVDFPEDYQELESVFVELPGSGTLVPFFIEHISITPKKSVVKFEDIDTIEQAEGLIKASLYLPLNTLPELEDYQFYFHEIIGFTVQDKNEGPLGTVKDVYAANGQDLLAMDYKNREILIPISNEIVPRVDKAQKIIFTHLPEGLLDIYLS